MLRGASGDPEDALQDVFIRAYRALRANDRPVTLRAWLYRIAHNRCIDELRRPCPLPSELAADAEPAFGAPGVTREPGAVAERSAELARLIADVRALPTQQRSALLMRELQGLTYEELAVALATTVPAVKSLLLRARTGLIDIAVARDTPCDEIRDELLCAADRSVRISGRARRHCAECTSCESYRGELRRVRRSFAALTPAGPLGQLGMLLGIGGGGGGAAAAGGGGAAAGSGVAAAGGGTAVASGGMLAGMTAAKIAVVVCCAALITTAGRAVIAPSHSSAPRSHAVLLPPSPSRIATITAPATLDRALGNGPTPPPSGLGPSGAVSVSSGATGVSGATGASGATGPTGVSGTNDAPGSTEGDGSAPPTGGATGSTGIGGVVLDSAPAGIGAAGTRVSGAGAGTTAPAGATGSSGSTGATGATTTADGRYDTGKSSSSAGGGIGGSAAAAPPSGPGGG